MEVAFVESEVDRTKCRWVAGILREWGRPRATLRALYYYALSRKGEDYPICGGFVGEIRILRQFHPNDGPKLAKWAARARDLGYIGRDAIAGPAPVVLVPPGKKTNIEVWTDSSDLAPSFWPACLELGAVLVALDGQPIEDDLVELSMRSPSLILTLTDMSPPGLAFSRDLKSRLGDPGYEVRQIGLLPEQVVEMDLPLVAIVENAERWYEDLLKRHRLPSGVMAELDCLELYHPSGIAGFVKEELAKHCRQRIR